MSKRTTAADRAAAIERLHRILPPGALVTTFLRHRARSGMSRRILPCIPCPDRPGEIRDLSGYVADALGCRWHDDGGVIVRGCGMDMGSHLVYSLSRVLYPQGFGCIGEGCPSNDHSNGDRDYTPHPPTRTACPDPDSAECKRMRCHWHADGGYALRQRWL